MIQAEKLIQQAKTVLQLEGQAVLALAGRMDKSLVEACEIILACSGRVVFTGMGKSGHIGGKAAATFASTGTPAFFVHPGEASHGDLGMIAAGDVVLALSNSGETDEILTILPLIKRLRVPLIALTGNPASRLAKQADVHLDISVEKEACPLNLAPTTSTTVTLALTDALAVGLLQSRGFTAEDFARSHPGGKLGRRLLLTVADLMHTGIQLPAVPCGTGLRKALDEMSDKGLGFTAIVDQDQHLAGIYTDGDLRRSIDQNIKINEVVIDAVMTTSCHTVRADCLAVDALNMMEEAKIFALPVVDNEFKLTGALHMHDLLRAGVV